MERTVKWENDGLKVEFTFKSGSNGKVNLEAKALKMSAQNTRYVPFRVFNGTHIVSCELPTVSQDAIQKHCADTIENVKSHYTTEAKTKGAITSLVDGLLSSKAMPFAEVVLQAPVKKGEEAEASTEADAE